MTSTQHGNGEAGAAERKMPLSGRSAWIISDGKAGHEIQMLGVAEAYKPIF